MQAYAFVKHGLLENSLYIGHVLSYQTSIDREPRGCSIATFDLPLYSGDFHAGTIRNPCLGKLINNEHGDKNCDSLPSTQALKTGSFHQQVDLGPLQRITVFGYSRHYQSLTIGQ